MTNYGTRTGTGGPGTSIITNDDEILLDIPETIDLTEQDYANIKDERSY